MTTSTSTSMPASSDRRRRRLRQLKNNTTRLLIAGGGVGVIAALLLIFLYLLWQAVPLFRGADVQAQPVQKLPVQESSALYLSVADDGKTATRWLADGRIELLSVQTGEQIAQQQLALPPAVVISAVAQMPVASGLRVLGLSDGSLLAVQLAHAEAASAEADVTQAGLQPEFPYGAAPMPVLAPGVAIKALTVRASADSLLLAAYGGGRLVLQRYGKQGGLFAEESAALSLVQSFDLHTRLHQVQQILLGADDRWLYVVGDHDRVEIFRIDGDAPIAYGDETVAAKGVRITAATLLHGEVSLMLGDDRGVVSQWFMVRDTKSEVDHFHLQHIREFQLSARKPVLALLPEARRKGLVATDAGGGLTWLYTTSQRLLAEQQMTVPATAWAMTASGDGLLVENRKAQWQWFDVSNPHPEVSLDVLFNKIWYENRDAPAHAWQSSSGTTDFEPKFGQVPLILGTLKAAFFAMILAAPLAICGAMYTAMFMAPALRRRVKPAIELMQALPTVILGFIAGLWLAPLAENYLPGIFSLLLLAPLCILGFALFWMQLPRVWRLQVQGWEPLLLVPALLFSVWVSFALSQPVEQWLFAGDVRMWLEHEAGIAFDQRNALIVGITMGFAIIAPIFTLSEDALFAVPRHLSNGSLALGATQWQTLMRVILPTASPGIFSALMVGFGRAVGETMIVLMATGNTPVTNMNIFEGMRTLSANIAVEMGEAEVGSTHFRVLFLSALLLFLTTFLVNTVAEVIRNRLRKKYSSL